MKTLNGMIYMLVLCSIALNIAQYHGKLNAPNVVTVAQEQSQDEFIAGILANER